MEQGAISAKTFINLQKRTHLKIADLAVELEEPEWKVKRWRAGTLIVSQEIADKMKALASVSGVNAQKRARMEKDRGLRIEAYIRRLTLESPQYCGGEVDPFINDRSLTDRIVNRRYVP